MIITHQHFTNLLMNVVMLLRDIIIIENKALVFGDFIQRGRINLLVLSTNAITSLSVGCIIYKEGCDI